MKKKAVILCLCGFFLLLILLYLCPYPERIDVALDGFYYEESLRELGAPGTVRIQGILYRYLFREDVFRGDLSLGGFSWKDLSSIGCEKLPNGFSLFSFAIYNKETGRPGAVSLYSKGTFEKVILHIYNGTDAVQFVAPAQSINDTYLD